MIEFKCRMSEDEVNDRKRSKNSFVKRNKKIDEQLEKYYLHESGYGLDRRKFHDKRVHCCLYFIPPYVRGLVLCIILI